MTPPALPDGYEHGTTRAYRQCKPACGECRAANTAAASARRAARLAAGMPETAHGKPSGYTDYNCRCKRCKNAYRASTAKRVPQAKVKPNRDLMPAGDHGNARGYSYWNCPCPPCREVGRASRAEAKARKRAEVSGPSDVRRYRYQIYPEPATQRALRRVFGSCRSVYNSYIALARDRYASGEKHPTAYDAAKILVTAARKAPETEWLGEVAHSVLSSAVHDAGDAYERYFDSAAGRIKGKPVGRPKFKSRKSARRAARFPEGSFTIRGGWQNTSRGGGRLHLARIDQDIHVNWHRPLPGYASAVTVTEAPDGKFWVSFIVRVPTAAPKKATRGSRMAGVDVGIADYASIAYTDGTREKIANPRHLERAAERVRRVDKNLSRKQPGSSNHAKAKKARARVLRRVANLRENHARQLASKLSRENQTVCIETLDIASMVNSGHKVRAKRINDAGWGRFFRFLEEACDRKGVTLVKAPAYLPTTQVCSICGVNGGKKPVDIREWECIGCGALLDRDYNAAVNILTAGPAVDACGRDVRLRLAGAAPSEAGSHRNEARTGVVRRRERAPRRLVDAHAQATSESRKLKGFRPVVESRAA